MTESSIEKSKKLTKYQYRCNVTGNVKSVSPQVFKKRCTQWGTDEEGLRKLFVSSEGKRALREHADKSVKEIHQILGVTDAECLDVPQDVLLDIRSKKVSKSKKDNSDDPTSDE